MTKNKRWIKLNSVGAWLDIKTGYTFPIDEKEAVNTGNVDSAVHVEDCCEEWHECLSSIDSKIVDMYINPSIDKAVIIPCAVKAVK